MVMADISRQQKLASAKKKLKKFQKAKTPTSEVIQQNHNLSKEILNGIQNNHIFQTPPLGRAQEKTSTPNNLAINQKLNFQTPPETPLTTTPSVSTPTTPLIGAPRETEATTNIQPTKAGNTPQDNDIDSAIASYKRANQQLTEQVNEQRKQILLLQEKLKKEAGALAQLKDQKALKEQLEVHIQTIGILVSEKSELQSTIATNQKKLANKEKEFVDITNQLNGARQHLLEFEKSVAQLQTNEIQLRNINKEIIQERDRFSSSLYETNHQKEEINHQNSELQIKLKSKVEECSHLLNQVNELHTKLQKGDLIIQQLSSNSLDPSSLHNWNEEKENLMKTINDQKKMLEKLVADKVELSQKHNDLQSHFDIQVEELKNKINHMEDEKISLLERTQDLSISLEHLQQELENSVTERVEVPISQVESNEENKEQLHQLQNEKQDLEKELDIQINENRRLGRVVFEQNQKIESLETSMSQLNADSADKASLLDQIQADKETISRALQQNKTLKEQIEELQGAFVKMSTSSADLTTKLQSEQHGSKDVAEKLSTVQLELEETKVKLADKSFVCEDLEKQLCRFKEELNNVQMKLAEKEMDLDLVGTELETMKVNMSNNMGGTTNQEASFNQGELSGKLNDELSSAQDTINMLSNQNEQLQQTINQLQYNSRIESSTESTEEKGYEPAMYEEDEVEDELTEEEQHARNWGELDNDTSTDGEDSGYTNEAIQYTQAEVASLQESFNNLQEERGKILNLLQREREKAFAAVEKIEEHVDLKVEQMIKIRERELQEHFYEQTEALHSKVKSLQEALEVMRKNEDIADFDMTSDGITMPLLKTAFMQLQKRYKNAMDARAQLSDRIEQLEHTNMKLETETETIGEYIALYQTQRQALKSKFAEKDAIITQLSNEHARMQGKVSQLHQLVMQMLSERSGIESKNKTLQELVNRRLALQTNNSNGETNEISNLEYNLDHLFGQMTLTPEENELSKDNIIVDNEELNELKRDVITSSDQTTQQILNIFEQLETTGEGYQYGWVSPAARKHSFQPCKNCSNTIMHV